MAREDGGFHAEVLSASHLKSEDESYHLIRSRGQRAYNFVHFLTSVTIVSDGEKILTEPNACVLYSPGSPQEYYAGKGGFVNNYVTFTLSEAGAASLGDVPLNEVFYLPEADEVTRLIEHISWACADKLEDHGDDISARVLELLRLLIAASAQNAPKFKRAGQTKRRFTRLREEMAKNPAGWNADKMAKFTWLSRGRFTVLYKEFFGVSPIEDLTALRLAYAKTLLAETDLPVRDVAAKCGYAGDEYFIRLFKTGEGVTPGKYRSAMNNKQ